MSISQNFPNIKPSLNLDFANTELLDPRVTFTRAASAVYYDGKTVAKAEENLLLQSQDITTTWTNVGSTDSANTTTAPDGTVTADTFTESATISGHDVRQTGVNVISGLRYVWSIFAKKGDGATAPDIIQLTWATGGFGATVFANYDISVGGGTSGTVTTTGAGAVSASIVDAGNGWYRCVLIADATATATSGMTILFVENNPTATRAPSYLGVITANAFLWAAQLEQRSSVTAYTPTTTQAITNYIPQLLTAASGVARFDHNPTTGESLGLLVEEQRTNTILQSEAFATTWAVGTGNPIVSVNTAIAPDGTLTADKLIEGTTNGGQNILQTNVSFPSVGQYAYSVYVKKAERFKVSLRESTSTGATVLFDVNAGTVLSTTGGGTPAPLGLIQDAGNGWYRCTMILAQGTAANRTVRIAVVPDAVTTASASYTDYTGDGTSGIYIWGAQLEAGAFPTSYIPTVASQVTRAADLPSITGANFSSWFRADAGTFFVEASSYAGGGVTQRRLLVVDDGGTSNRMTVRYDPLMTTSAFTSSVSGTLVANIQSGTALTANVPYKNAGAYKTDDYAFAWAGSLIGTDTSAAVPSVNAARIGCGSSGEHLNGHIRRISYYPEKLSNAQLQALTS
jgi:hypothetical protein